MKPQLGSEESDFEAQTQAAWEEIKQFYANNPDEDQAHSPSNPQHRLAPQFFQVYLDRRPSELATKAASQAFMMWGNLPEGSERVEMALAHVSYDEDVWGSIVNGVLNAFYRDSRQEEARQLLEELVQKVTSVTSRSELLFQLAWRQMMRGEAGVARQRL